MADYLTRLASRTLGLTPVAEPVVAPLFAPEGPAMTVSDPGGFGEEIQVQSDPGIAPVRHPKPSATLQKKDDLPVALPSQPAQISKAAPQPFPVGEGSSDLGPPSQDSQSEGTPEERLAPPLPAPLAQRKSPGVSASPEDAIMAEPEFSTPPPQSIPRSEKLSGSEKWASLPDRPRPMVHPAVSIAAPRTEGGATFPPPEATPHLEKLVGEKPADPATLPDGSRSIFSRPLAPVPQPQPETLTEPLLVPSASAEISLSRQDLPVVGRQPVEAPKLRDQETPATIEITIGRVEVHAVYPPAPATRPRAAGPAPPRLSLEEYLRNQNGGRR